MVTSNMSTSPLESRILGIVDRQIEITEGVEYDKVSERDNSPQLFISFVMECGDEPGIVVGPNTLTFLHS